MSRSATIAALRAHIDRVAPARVLEPARLPAGREELERAFGGWPRPGISLVWGPPGSGRLGLLLPAMAALTARDRLVAVVDPLRRLHPPGLPGVRLDRLLLVRPGARRAAWAAEQLARCAGLDLLVLLDPGRLGPAGPRLRRAAEVGDTAVVVVAEEPEPALPARLRLRARPLPDGTRSFEITRGAPGARPRRLTLP